MLVGASIFAYAVSAIVAVVASFGEERRQYVDDHCLAHECPPAPPFISRYADLHPRTLCPRFNTSMDILNEYLEEYEFDPKVKTSLRKYFHHCRFDGVQAVRTLCSLPQSWMTYSALTL